MAPPNDEIEKRSELTGEIQNLPGASSEALKAEAAAMLSPATKPGPTSTPIADQYRFESPTINAITARTAYFGVQGRLFPDMGQIKSVMATQGPIGQAALQRMESLSQKGWTFGALTPSDPYLTRLHESAPKRWAFSTIVGGYHDAHAGRITHNAFTGFGHAVFGFANGADVEAANKYIHELAHGRYTDGYEKFESSAKAKTALRELPAAQRLAHNKAMIEEELRAIFAQVASNSKARAPVSEFLNPHGRGVGTIPAEMAIRENQAGRLIKDVWQYEGPKSLTTKEANQVASAYIKATYGELYVDGKLNPRAEAAIAREIAELPVKAPLNAAAGTAAAETSLMSSKYMPYFSRGAQALGSLGLMYTVSDVRNQYNQSFGAGTGRLLSVGSDWAGFEAGLAAGTHMGRWLSSGLVKINPKLAMLAAPIATLGSGIFGAELMHRNVSKHVEKGSREAIDNLLD